MESLGSLLVVEMRLMLMKVREVPKSSGEAFVCSLH